MYEEFFEGMCKDATREYDDSKEYAHSTISGKCKNKIIFFSCTLVCLKS